MNFEEGALYLDGERLKADETVVLDQAADGAIERSEFVAGPFGLQRRFEVREVLHFCVVLEVEC